jgi:hypothetical protein
MHSLPLLDGRQLGLAITSADEDCSEALQKWLQCALLSFGTSKYIFERVFKAGDEGAERRREGTFWEERVVLSGRRLAMGTVNRECVHLIKTVHSCLRDIRIRSTRLDM